MSDHPFPPHEDLAPLFERAHREALWFQHTGMHDEIFMSPYELEKEMRAGNYRWGATNWELVTSDQLRERHYNEPIREMEEERARFDKLVSQFERQWHLDHRM